MSEELTASAMNSKFQIDFNGHDISLKQSDEEKEQEDFEKNNKAAVHQALTDINNELGIKTEEKKKKHHQKQKKDKESSESEESEEE